MLPADLAFRWGIWGGSNETITISFNGNIIGTPVVSNAYWSTPTYADYNVTGLLTNGNNLISFQESDMNQSFAIGKISLTYNGGGGAPVPEPCTMLLLGLGLIGVAGVRRKFKK